MHQEPRFHFIFPGIFTAACFLIVVLLHKTWAPGFPLTAKLISVPDIYIARASQDAIIREILVKKNKILKTGQKIVCLAYLQEVSEQRLETSDLKRLQEQLRRLNYLLVRQKHMFRQYQALAYKKMISMTDLLQKKDELRHLIEEQGQLRSQIEAIKLKLGTCLTMPYSGQLEQQLVLPGQIVRANQALMVFRPLVQRHFFKAKVAWTYHNYIKMNQVLKLNFLQEKNLNRYPITAHVSAIYPHVINPKTSGSNAYYLLLKARVEKIPKLKELAGIRNLPFEGYLIAERKPIYQWILSIIKG